ncbi:DUF3631 domain-containing protein [Streptomyces tubercidicus]|uniref:DUF3631 domain-containing protein n=1 Tax=Streptomyces tubercidicus TaxID=47759 RepID=A0A640UV33_9ACTN|nr:DUF3631 domain-containing protein [Streptomyces tubercidicus]WAU12750.1 DUF3631 domain-containing protein [Streptomyces tubercidicus]GFE38245.1 hypothetical protein Stube_29180 [Streptomyces tubercidicus]
MQPENPESYSAPARAGWPATAIPGQPGAHMRAVQADSAEADPSGGAVERSVDEADAASELEDLPDAEPTAGSNLLDELRSQVAQIVIPPSSEALDAITLWVAATHLQPAWQHAPRLAVVGPAKRCGKSRLLDVLTETVHEPMLTINTTPAAIFRSISEEEPPTLLVDEADTIFGPKVAEKNEETRGLLNAGHQRGRYVTRVVGNDHTPHKFATFAMAAIAGIGDLPDTVMDRSVVIRMRRRAEGEKVRPFRSRRDIPALHEIRDRIHAWARPLLEEAANLEPDMPVEDRAADTWEPLVIVADLAGGRWPRLARVACVRMVNAEVAAEEDHPSGARILADIRRVFFAQREVDSLSTGDLLHHLRQDAEAPWAERGRDGLTARELSRMLRDFDIRPGNVRMADGRQLKGYMRNKFLDAWRRYCPTVHPVDAGPTPSSG